MHTGVDGMSGSVFGKKDVQKSAMNGENLRGKVDSLTAFRPGAITVARHDLPGKNPARERLVNRLHISNLPSVFLIIPGRKKSPPRGVEIFRMNPEQNKQPDAA